MELVNVNFERDYEVLSSGSVITIPGIPVVFSISGLKFYFEFADDSTNPNQHAEIKSQDQTQLRLVFYNFNNSLGTGNRVLIPLGKISGKELFLSYRIYAINPEMGKLFVYSLYLKNAKSE